MSAHGDNLHHQWNRFKEVRSENLFDRFPGSYRAVVVETNDPLGFYRVKFRCPELHDWALPVEDCPWAVPAPWLGGKNTGSFSHPCIGDIIWITWEKSHPYGPIWCGFADETRRRRYPLESIFIESPTAVDKIGNPTEAPDDWKIDNDKYLTKDRRPMQVGWSDRYGNSRIARSNGFFPTEHDIDPYPQGVDGINVTDFRLRGSKPEVNNPDMKYVVDVTKYGNYMIMSDVGYYWKKDGNFGEFVGQPDPLEDDNDINFEIKRYHFLTKHFNEQEPDSSKRDQRRMEFRTRAGHLIEARDVGWAQSSGGRAGSKDAGQTKSRDGEYSDPKVLSKWENSDERWIKIRTKGGHIMQFMDAGFHPGDDKFYSKTIDKEVGPNDEFDHEEKDEWTKRDARQMRYVTRHGFKFVLDDRGSHATDAESEHNPKGNGWLLKTRRNWKPDDEQGYGFGFEANDKPTMNRMMAYTPKSKIFESNDEYDYMIMCTDTKDIITEQWKKLEENEFARKVAMSVNPEEDTYHLKLDKHNGYIRFKTAAGFDNGRRSEIAWGGGEGSSPSPQNMNDGDVADSRVLQQGLEARDGRYPPSSVWVELVDMQDRGLFITKQHKGANGLQVWRSKGDEHNMFMAMSEVSPLKDHIVISNIGEKIHIYCSKDISIHAGRDLELAADRDIKISAGRYLEEYADRDIKFKSNSAAIHSWAKTKIVREVPPNSDRLVPGYLGTKFQFKAHTVLGVLPEAAPGGGAQSPAPDADTAQQAVKKEPTFIDVSPKKPDDRADKKQPTDSVDEVPEDAVKDTWGFGEQ